MRDTQQLDFRAVIGEISANFQQLAECAQAIEAAAEILIAALAGGGRVFFCGNGGSAADSQHLAAELVGRYQRERGPLAGIALSVDTSALTAIANDYGYEQVFARQLRGLGHAGDALVALSTSGASPNVLACAQVARELGVEVVALTGEQGGPLAELAKVCVPAPARRADRVQEMHIAVGHMLCDSVERAFTSSADAPR